MRYLPFCIAGMTTLSVVSSFAAVSPTVSNVVAGQRTDGTKFIDIHYNLTDPDSATVAVYLKVSKDGGASYTIIPKTVTGDVGDAVVPGANKQIVWDAGADIPYTLGSNFKVSISAQDCPRYLGELVTIPEGSFSMGKSNTDYYGFQDEFPVHQVSLSAYQISKFEVTRYEFRRFMDSGGYDSPVYWSEEGWAWKSNTNRTEPNYWTATQTWGYTTPTTFTQTDAHPVIGVSYYEAEAFCKWAGGHLPTEAQWEKAARWDEAAQKARIYPWGDLWDSSRCNSWLDATIMGYQTAPVGSYSAPSWQSPYGLHDMAGNAFEWVKDVYSATYYSTVGGFVNPEGPLAGDYRVLRGGSWGDDENLTRASCRAYAPPTDCYQDFGFRIAK